MVTEISQNNPKSNSRISVELTENQKKVITDKYLKNDPSPESWLERVSRNIALAEIVFSSKADTWGAWKNIHLASYHVETKKGKTSSLRLYHEGISRSKDRHENFSQFLSNLNQITERVSEAGNLVNEWTTRFYNMMARFDFLPNSPTLMNAGRDLQQLSACYVLPVEDSMEGVTDALKAQALIHKSGGGTGFSFQRLRPSGDGVQSTHGVASGAISFMQIFDKMTQVVKQGGTRRGANMGILPYWHPEIEDFIKMKSQPGVMENFNVSVTIDDKFIKAVEQDQEYDLINPRTGKPTGVRKRARVIFDMMVDYAWQSGDPGIIVIDRINNSQSNPTPQLGQIESTNPCFAGNMRLATNRGLLTFEELYLERLPIQVLTDNRVLDIRTAMSSGKNLVKTKAERGVKLRSAVPVFKTRHNWPVFTLNTRCGFEVTATEDHKFFTPQGLKRLKDLKPGDEILIQSGSGVWNCENHLPPFIPENKLAGRIRRGECRLPTEWSEELGRLLGWVIGDGWVSCERPKGRSVPNYTVGLIFGNTEKKVLAPRFQSMIKEWVGLDGTDVERAGTLSCFYKSSLFYFLRSLGLEDSGGLQKEVPFSLWQAPRSAVKGFLRGLFTADGTVNVSPKKGSCSIRLANSSKRLLQQVQLLLLNEGILSKIYLRRRAGKKLMPDSKRQPKFYSYADQYELVLDGQGRDLFVQEIGFIVPSKQKKAVSWICSKKRKSNRQSFIDRVHSIIPQGRVDVYCTTEPETHSIISNGFVTAQCGEQPLLPNEPCNLGSINLSNFVKGDMMKGEMDWDRLGDTVRLSIRFLDNVIEVNNYPLTEIEKLSKGNRRIGLGVMGWAEALVKMGIPYDSDESLNKARELMAYINHAALKASEDLAEERGAFPNWKESIFDPEGAHFSGKESFVRHCARTTIAPTGTIGLAAGLQGGGIEPFFAISYVRYNAQALEAVKKGVKPEKKDVFYEVNSLFRQVAYENNFFGLDEKELWKKIDQNHKSVKGIPEIPENIQKIFRSSHDVPVPFHVKIQAAFQEYTDNAVSKTINMPNSATREDVKKAYLSSYHLGCKGITIYRDGSKTQQVLNLGAAGAQSKKEQRKARDASQGLSSQYFEIRTGHGDLHIHIDYDDSGPFRVFANLSPIGTEMSGLTSVVSVLLSKYLEAGGDPIRILKHLNSVKGDRPFGFGQQRVDSIPHAIAIALREHLKKTGKLESNLSEKPGHLELWDQSSALYCPECYSSNVSKESGCSGVTCRDCGYSECS